MTSPHQTISIVTPSYNQGEFIAATIESVLAQAGDFYIDYIVVDAGSTDNSVAIISSYERQLQDGSRVVNCLGVRFRWISEADKGQADGINKGFSLATGSVFGWLNSDDLYAPGALQQVMSLDWRKSEFCYGKGVWIACNGDELGFYPTFRPNRYSLYYQCTLCQPTVFFSRDAFERLGELSLAYDLVFDYEYWLRGVFSGMRFSFIPALLARSRMYRENKSLSFPVTAKRERTALLEHYYGSLRLNRMLLFFRKLTVDNKTHREVRTLLAKLEAEAPIR